MDTTVIGNRTGSNLDIIQRIDRLITFLFHLFFQKKFLVHRLVGLLYLIQYALCFYWYCKNYETFKESFLIWSLPLTGLIQSIIATLTFTFLSRTKIDPGYYSDRGTLSYAFIVENTFFAGLLLFQWLYYSDFFYYYINNSIIIDNLIVFLPYILRQLWPKTHFRDSLKNSDKNKTTPNRKFYIIVTIITKVFYVWAKHYIGYFLNYIRFFDLANSQQISYIYLLLIFSAFATTISVFLHTLKFKGYIGPRTSYIIYMASYLATFYSFIQIRDIFFIHYDLAIYVLIGVVINFQSLYYQHIYQIILLILFNSHKFHLIPTNIDRLDFHPIYDRENIQYITTYLCLEPYPIKKNVNIWFGDQPCVSMDQSMLIYEWYHNIPSVQWPKDAGFRVGAKTLYRYIVINIKYFSSISNNIYGEHVTMTRKKPKYQIGTYEITTNAFQFQRNFADFSCQYHSSSMEVFSALLFSNPEGNLHWPQTFYQLQNSIDIEAQDYLIGTCIYEDKYKLPIESRDQICEITLLFYMKQDDKIPLETCENNGFPDIADEYLPVDINIPKTLFDINSIYPNKTPDEWAIMNRNISSLIFESNVDHANISESNTDHANTLYLTYTNINNYQEIVVLIHSHKLLFILLIWILLLIVGLFILLIVILRTRKYKIYISTNKKRTTAITIGGETGSLSGWLTKRRFQQYGDDGNTIENEPLTTKHRWTSDSEESDLSETEVHNSTDFRNVVLRN
ncbi:unnamed protein product [Adineta steineri]|uniref:Transmembrane protein n=4 Tax=Adineta steineri TaxID=433720 RepID=A0A813S1D0_9BILA|nr:unnamed protein product [Adineta steineri]CAF3710240.1 unnamed protein product [Adineta steineri]